MRELLLGNEAVARGAYEAGAVVSSAYPGTPSTEISEYIALYDEVYAEWAPNEKAALETALGAAVAGGRAVCAMKHVGLNVASDPMFTASYTGVNAGLVICVADDPGMYSSQDEQDSRHYAVAAKLPMLEPADSAECLEFTKLAFDISERFDTPVLLRLSTRVSHSRGLAETSPRVEKPLRDYKKDPLKYVMMPAMARGRHVAVEKRQAALKTFAEDFADNKSNKIEWNDKKIGVITDGIAYCYAKEALGGRASYFKLGLVNPLPDKALLDFAASVETLYVIEELDPVIENHCRALGLSVIGKEKLPIIGELSPNIISEAVLGIPADINRPAENLPARPPVMCAGCPHRGVFFALTQLGLTVSGDIGCYTLGALAPINGMDTCFCMGASISVAHGMEKARGREFSKKTVAILGDSTFLHTGVPGLINVVYNKSSVTTIILDNSITGMTGHQQNPATGVTLKGETTRAVDLKLLCEAIGVRRVRVVDPFFIKEMKQTLKEELAADEPSVIIAQRPCALLKTFKTFGKRAVDKEKCVECGQCMKIACPAITRVDGRVTIDRAQCAGCTYCEGVCPRGAIGKYM